AGLEGWWPGTFAFPTFSETKETSEDTVCFINVEQKYEVNFGPTIQVMDVKPINPVYSGPFDITPSRLVGAQAIRKAYNDNQTLPQSLLAYFDEAWYFVPMHIALQLQRNGYYTEALDWFRNIYDYSALPGQQKVYYGLVTEDSLKPVYERGQDWRWLG